jgi:hypothetical protein
MSIGLLFIRDGKLVAAFGPAALEHKPSSPGLHPGPEPEFTVPLYLAGLIRPFHGNNSSIFRKPPKTVPGDPLGS